MSVQRAFAQRKSNVQQLTPLPADNIGFAEFPLAIDPVNNPILNVDISNLKGSTNAGAITFDLNYDTTIASKYPGLEFTIMFDCNGVNFNGTNKIEYLTLNTPDFTFAQTYNGSTKLPFQTWTTKINIPIVSFTLKSNGRLFTIVSTTPAAQGWSNSYGS